MSLHASPQHGSDPEGEHSRPLPHVPPPSQITQIINEEGGKRDSPDPSDLDLSPEGLLDVVGVLGGLSLSPDGQCAIVPQRGRYRCGVHIFRQLAFVGEGIHDGAVCSQLGKKWVEKGDFRVQAG